MLFSFHSPGPNKCFVSPPAAVNNSFGVYLQILVVDGNLLLIINVIPFVCFLELLRDLKSSLLHFFVLHKEK